MNSAASVAKRIAKIKSKSGEQISIFNNPVAEEVQSKKLSEGKVWTPEHFNDDMWVAPYCVLRSALFSVVKRGKRKEYKQNAKTYQGEKIASWNGYEITMSGFQLDQADFDCLLACIEACKTQGFGDSVVVTKKQLLQLMKRAASKDSYLWLDKSLARLVSAKIGVLSKKRKVRFFGSFLSSFAEDQNSSKFALKINYDLSKLFVDGTSYLEKKVRLSISGDLDKWLYSYIYSHDTSSKPHVVSLEKLRELCGSGSDSRRFRFKAKEALERLESKKLIAFEVKGKADSSMLYVSRLK